MSRAGVVLCGGRSSRMGRAKAWLPWFGKTMIEHVVERLSKSVDEIVVVTSASLSLPDLARFGARIVRDREPERGPLAGIRDGLGGLESDAEFVFVTSTDAPFLTERYVSNLLERNRVCAPLSEGFVQVLSAVYPRDAWAMADQLLSEGAGRPLALLEALDYEPVEPRDLVPESESPAWHGFNTPGAYLAAVRSIDASATTEVEFVARDSEAENGWRRRAPVGTLGEVLQAWAETRHLAEDGVLSAACGVRLEGGERLQDLAPPLGPGECIRVVEMPDTSANNEADE